MKMDPEINSALDAVFLAADKVKLDLAVALDKIDALQAEVLSLREKLRVSLAENNRQKEG
jgi:hypothetical protein